MKLTKRLQLVASYFSSFSSMADIGTDHAFLPVYLAHKGGYQKIIATDLNIKPLERAREEVVAHNLTSLIELRRGSGLQCLQVGEVQAAAIAGMGGETIRDILQDSLPVAASMDLLVLQPMSKSYILREWLQYNSFSFYDEELVEEDHHLFEIIVVQYGQKTKEYSNLQLEIGPLLLEKKHPLLLQQLEKLLYRYQQVFQHLAQQDKHCLQRQEVSQKIEELKGIVKWLKHKQ